MQLQDIISAEFGWNAICGHLTHMEKYTCNVKNMTERAAFMTALFEEPSPDSNL